ncbi:hypothetical protein NVS89_02830 [Ancylobacter sp. MQZ15Z-1]|uniref:Uncharacterized protein n=1 Tax=Ancylobacter mangrovi TaxID=2972472 RepID=A0A9X2T2N8_9HYPH|nr:hypothetical protein [Ancylobacter mangrovi]MCS0494016.1 hypothetical protein [Ancylobacter mangrovi]
MFRSLTRLLILVMCLATVAAAVSGRVAVGNVAIAAGLGVVVLQWLRVSTLARLFTLVAVAAGAFIVVAYPGEREQLRTALLQGVSFASFMSVLGLMRYPVRTSAIIKRAAGSLLSFPASRRYAAVNIGSHFLSLLFNVGIIRMIGDLLSHADHTAEMRLQRRDLLLAGMRGAVLMTIWSPMGLGFAIVTTSVVGLNAVPFLALACATALTILLVTCVVAGRAGTLPLGVAAPGTGTDPVPLLVVMGASALLLALTVGLHVSSGLSSTISTIIVLPLFALFWLVVEPPTPAPPLLRRIWEMTHGIEDMRTEATVLMSANVIGAAISIVVRHQSFWDALQHGHYPPSLLLILCLVLIPLAGAAFIPHTILVVLLAQLLGPSTLGLEHPMMVGLTLTLGWALGTSASPISVMSLTTGALTGTPSYVVGFIWNRGFVMTVFGCAVLALSALYMLGG